MPNRIPLAFSVVSLALVGLLAVDLNAAPPQFEKDIAPIFASRCVACHSPTTMKAELDLTTPQAIFKGSESGAIVTPGKLDESLLYDMVHDRAMPPEESPQLSAAQIDTIKRWIEAGTPLASGQNPEELLAAGEVSNHDIEPLMLLRCTACHGARAQEGGLDLRTKTSMLKGGKSGPAIKLGDADASLIIQKIKSGEMPPKDKLILSGVKPITPSEVERLSRWIELNAPEVFIEPDVATDQPDPLVSAEDRQFWAFQPPRRVPLPAVSSDRVRNPIDAFVHRRLEEHGLNFADEADRSTLIRRAWFDLTGLPPTPAEVDSVMNDSSPQWYRRMIDRLLASPRYGERWGRFWLDAAGYADSEGKRSADPIRPYAYKYRDYVIRSFNADKPYDRFLLEQIAGDELADYEHAETVTQELVDNLIATGFLRMAPDGTGSDVVNFTPERLEVISDEIDIFSSTILGMTMKCARCHSHKYDPIPQRDYYRLASIFKGAFDEHDWLKPSFVPGQTKVVRPGRVLPVATAAELAEVEQRNRDIDREIAGERKSLAELAESIRASHRKAELAKLPKELHAAIVKTLDTASDKRTAEQKTLAKQYEERLTLNDAELKKHQGYSRAQVETNRVIKSLESEKTDEPAIRALWDRGEPTPTYIYVRGDFMQPGRLVGPGVPSVLTDGQTPFAIEPPWPGAKKTGRRLSLAKWLVKPDHPLTARVMVNRIWKHHFGEGIVRSLDNFGKLGTPPTHPELLDWLARRFVDDGWSIKRLHRLILTSTTWRQASAVAGSSLERDPDNRWLSRMPLRRLEAEELRDSLLQVAGRLDDEQFGRPAPVDARKDGLVTSKEQQGGWRRSVYVRQRRKEIPTILATFDLPQMNPNCRSRTNSTVAQQALHLMNDGLVRRLARSFAERVQQTTADPQGQVDEVWRLALGRLPTEEERTPAVDTLVELREAWAGDSDTGDSDAGDSEVVADAERRALSTFCHTVLNSAAYLFVD